MLKKVSFVIFLSALLLGGWWFTKSSVEKWLFFNESEVMEFALTKFEGKEATNVPESLKNTPYAIKNKVLMIMFRENFDEELQNYREILYFLPSDKEFKLVSEKLENRLVLSRVSNNWYLAHSIK